MNEGVDAWLNELMDGRATFLCWASPLSDLFASLSYFFPGQPLIWATSALSFLPASFSVASAAQPPAAIPLAMSVAASLMLCCAAVPMRLSQPAAARRQLSQIEACNRGNSDPASATPGATLPENNRDSRPREFHPWIHALPNCYTSQLLGDDSWCGWHDDVEDVVDMTMGFNMMMRLTWWCEC